MEFWRINAASCAAVKTCSAHKMSLRRHQNGCVGCTNYIFDRESSALEPCLEQLIYIIAKCRLAVLTPLLTLPFIFRSFVLTTPSHPFRGQPIRVHCTSYSTFPMFRLSYASLPGARPKKNPACTEMPSETSWNRLIWFRGNELTAKCIPVHTCMHTGKTILQILILIII